MKLPLTIGAKVASAIYDADGVPVCVIDSMQETSRGEEVEMARRIVACVNACEGLPESALKPGIIMAQAIQAQELIAQRDELLAALELAVEQMESDAVGIEYECGCGRSLEELDRLGQLPEAILEARAAIARAKGEQQPFTEMGGVCRCDVCGFTWLEGEHTGAHTCKGGAA